MFSYDISSALLHDDLCFWRRESELYPLKYLKKQYSQRITDKMITEDVFRVFFWNQKTNFDQI